MQVRPQPRLQALTIERELSYDDEFGFGESDDEVGDEEDIKCKSDGTSRAKFSRHGQNRIPGETPLLFCKRSLAEFHSSTEIISLIIWSMLVFSAHKARVPRRSRITVDPEAILVDAPDFRYLLAH